ncbi:hypothetical protein RISK_004082 [Rhodopirellula islandica]|uniref:Uncharacterized protein n=1 Tax=Rhodopirellula islandica TaxID=595434 RepID=A0A0J1BAC9_RHOIS|nr:hypothetical protein RISK_004082 [Rhodopirellula islandica]
MGAGCVSRTAFAAVGVGGGASLLLVGMLWLFGCWDGNRA